MYEWKGGPTQPQPRKRNWLSILFVILAAIGFAGLMLVTGATSADSLSAVQIFCLGAGSAATAGLGIVGYMVCGEVKVK